LCKEQQKFTTKKKIAIPSGLELKKKHKKNEDQFVLGVCISAKQYPVKP